MKEKAQGEGEHARAFAVAFGATLEAGQVMTDQAVEALRGKGLFLGAMMSAIGQEIAIGLPIIGHDGSRDGGFDSFPESLSCGLGAITHHKVHDAPSSSIHRKPNPAGSFF